MPQRASSTARTMARRPGVPADDGAPGGAGGGGGDERLDLDEQRPGALDAGEDRGAGGGAVALGEEERRGVRDLGEAGAGHLEDADLVGRAEAVLDRAQDAELVAALALEVEHGVDHVLDDARAGDLAVLGDVADEDDRGAAALGEGDELVGRRRGPGRPSRGRCRRGRPTWSGSSR